ncbi:MAG: hypothetical protein ABI811_13815 [Acidobacteriota bacterium]
MSKTFLFLMSCMCLYAGPVDFGKSELQTALGARGMVMSIETEINLDQPETYRIAVVKGASVRVSGGDLRGLMYGLIEASEQIRNEGKFTAKSAQPGLSHRGVRLAASDADLAQPAFYSTDRWLAFYQMLARNRVNRFTLVLPSERMELDRIRFLSRTANEFGVDFVLGVRPPLGNRSLYAQLRKVLDECVLVRGIEVQIGREPVEFFRTVVFPALQESGRRVALDLHGAETRPDVIRAAKAMGLVLDVTGRASSAPADFKSLDFHALIAADAAVPEADPVRTRLTSIANTGAAGFEIDLPGPNIENYERTYWAWGRLGYDHLSPTLGVGSPPAKANKK